MTRQSAIGSAPLSALLASAERQFPGYRANRIFLPPSPQDAAFAQLTGPDGAMRYASLDPGSAQVLAAGTVWRFPLEAALQLHYRLMDGRTGLAIVLANGLALLLMAGTGLGFWWPKRGGLAQSLAIGKSAPARIRLRHFHRSAGVIAALLLLFSAATGLLLVAPDLYEAGAPTAPTPLPPRTAAQIDRAVALAAAQFPGSALRDIRLPAGRPARHQSLRAAARAARGARRFGRAEHSRNHQSPARERQSGVMDESAAAPQR